MKILKRSTFFIIVFIYFTLPLEAATPASINLVGVDNDQSAIANLKDSFQIASFTYFSLNQATAITKLTYDTNTLITDAVKMGPATGLHVTLDANSDNNITPLSYTDLLLTAGIYDSSIQVYNNTTTVSLAEAINAYRQMGQKIPDARIASMVSEYNLLNEVNNQIHDSEKTAQIFFDMNKDLMANPDLNIVTNGIVDISVKREKATLTKDTLSKLYKWTYQMSQNGNQWEGFYRDVTITKSQDQSITIVYKALESAAANVQSNTNSGKIGALIVFLIFVSIVMYFAYKNKKNNI